MYFGQIVTPSGTTQENTVVNHLVQVAGSLAEIRNGYSDHDEKNEILETIAA